MTSAAEDDVPNAARVVIISDGLWKRRFGGATDIVGRRVVLNGEPHEIIGVLPADFRPIVTASADLWRPLRLNVVNPARGAVVLRAVARLADGLTVERAQRDASALAHRLEAEHPEFNEKTGFLLIPLHDRVVGDIRGGLLALLGSVAFVLLIACANIANLLMARASSRCREFAVRVALGAARGRVIRQLLTESLLLAVLGGAAGLILGTWSVDALLAIAPAGAPRLNEVRFDRSVFLFASRADTDDRAAFRAGSRAAIITIRRRPAIERWRAWRVDGGRPRHQAGADRAGSGAGAHAADWRRTADADLPQAAGRRPRLRACADARRIRESAAGRRLRHDGEAPRVLRPGARPRERAAWRSPRCPGLGAAARRRQRHELSDRGPRGRGPLANTGHLVSAHQRRLLRGDGHASGAWPHYHQARSLAVRGGERDVRTEVLPGRGSARTPHPIRRATTDRGSPSSQSAPT